MGKTKKTILIIEDHADTQLIVAAYLKKHQYTIALASDAVQAVCLAQKIRPDGILLDLGLPGGNGLLVLQRLKALAGLAKISVIILTADDSPENETELPDRPHRGLSHQACAGTVINGGSTVGCRGSGGGAMSREQQECI